MMTLMKMTILTISVMVSVAFLTLMERKMLSIVGMRVGPNKVSMMGVMQPMSDAIKLSNKQTNFLSSFNQTFYYMSSIMTLTMTLLMWMSMTEKTETISIKMPLMMMMMTLTVMTLKFMLGGWATSGKYPVMGSIRTVSILISFESVLFLCLMSLIFIFNTFKYSEMKYLSIYWMMVKMPLMMYLWYPSMLADLSRTPWDFSEGESEIVSGFNTEFGSKSFTLLFLSEYSNILFFSLLTTNILGLAFNTQKILMTTLILITIIWTRATLPRHRFDKMMSLAWKNMIPLGTILLMTCMVMTI